MEEKLDKYYLLTKYGFFSIEDLNEMSECEMTMLANEIKKQLKTQYYGKWNIWNSKTSRYNTR